MSITDAPLPDSTDACPDCGSDVPPGRSACPQCGCPVVGPTNAAACPDCARDLPPGSAHCPWCGAPVGGDGAFETGPSPEPGTTEPRPAVRWLARLTDYWIGSVVIGVAAAAAAPALLDANNYLLGVIVVVAFIPVEAWALARYGATPGKWMLSLQVVTDEGRRLRFDEALRRALLVFWRGLGALLPIVPLFTMAHQARVLIRQGRTSWDRDMGLEVVSGPVGPLKTIGLLVFWGAMILFMMLGMETG